MRKKNETNELGEPSARRVGNIPTQTNANKQLEDLITSLASLNPIANSLTFKPKTVVNIYTIS